MAGLNELKVQIKLISRLTISHPYVVDTVVDKSPDESGEIEPNQPVFELRVFRIYEQDANMTGFTNAESGHTDFELNDRGIFKVPIFPQESKLQKPDIVEKTKNAMLLAEFEAVYDEENKNKDNNVKEQLLCVANYFLNEQFPNPDETICHDRKNCVDVHFVIGYDDEVLFKDGIEIRQTVKHQGRDIDTSRK